MVIVFGLFLRPPKTLTSGKGRWRPQQVLDCGGPPAALCRAKNGPFYFRACIKMESGPAAADFGCGQGGELRASSKRAVSNEPTPATGKRRAVREGFSRKRPSGPATAGLLLAHRSTGDMLVRRVSPSGLLHENRPTFHFDTGS